MPAKPDTRKQMFRMIEKWRQSNLTQRSWCTEMRIPYHTFQYWLKKYRKNEKQERLIPFVELKVPTVAVSPYCELHLPDGRRLVFPQGAGIDVLQSLIRS